jgi:membrane associated rhomboid family serine protease
MGINDRDYVRKEGPSFLGAFVERGTICKWLIGINVAVFIVQLVTSDPGADGPFTQALLLDVNKVVFHGEVWRLITHAFLHTPRSVWHIIFNMLFLWWFGSDVEDLYGPREFLIFYLCAAVLAGVVFSAANLMGLGGDTGLGASGAVLAVIVLCACHYPTRTIRLLFFFPMPLWVLVLIFIARDAYTLLSREETTVGVAAHLGGAAFGFLYYRMNWRISPLLQGWWPNMSSWRRRVVGPRLRVYHEEQPEPIRTAVASSTLEEDRIKVEMDAVLEKISRVGRSNLSESDLEVLQRASEILRRRRT